MTPRIPALLGALALAAPAPAADIVVTPADDVSAVIALAQPGDTILMQPGVYAQQILLPATPLTVRGVAGAEQTIVDVTGMNLIGMRILTGATAATTVEDLTVRGADKGFGAGMRCRGDASPTIVRCVFADNVAFNGSGGGVHVQEGTPAFVECTFAGNTATEHGAGVYVESGTPTFTDCAFEGNVADIRGGGLYVDEGAATLERCLVTGNDAVGGGGVGTLTAPVTLTDCEIVGNTASVGAGVSGGAITITGSRVAGNVATNGGAGLSLDDGSFVSGCVIEGNLAGGRGAGIDALFATITLEKSVLRGNVGEGRGGGLYYNSKASTVEIKECVFEDNVCLDDGSGLALGGGMWVAVDDQDEDDAFFVLDRCAFVGNEADGDGGGVWVDLNEGVLDLDPEIFVRNCLFAGNESGGSGGGIFSEASSIHKAAIDQTTFADNVAATSGGGVWSRNANVKSSILWGNAPDQQAGTLTFASCDVQGGAGGPDVIDADPLFADPAARDYHILYGSPCRDASAIAAGPNFDFEGDPRDFGGARDMGFDEFAPHLYTLGDPVAGGDLTVAVMGVPGAGPVVLVLGASLLEPPATTPFGSLEVAPPLLTLALAPVPPDGRLALDTTLPPDLPAVDVPVQALAGDVLTNAIVLGIEGS